MRRAIPLFACVILSGCSGEGPFVETFPADIRKYAQLHICHDKWADEAAIEALARDACKRLDKEAEFLGRTRHQCSLLAPHRASYRCIAPK